jgi:MFS family permease
MFILPDYPHTTSFLTTEERLIAVNRLKETGMKDHSRTNLLTGLRLAITDYKVWLLGLIIITKTSASAVTSFIPTLVNTFGLTKVQTLLLVAPPYVIAAAVSLFVSRMSDKRNERSMHIAIPMCCAIFGFAIAALTLRTWIRYVSLFLMLSGVYGSYNVALAWISSTLPHPAEKRSAAIAMINTMGNVAQIYSPYFYLPEQGPRYLMAMVANMSFCFLCIGVTIALRTCLSKENEKLDKEQWYMEEEEVELSDRYRYAL